MAIVSIGAVLWDVFDSAERIGGAPFNFSAHARKLGHDVVFISAVGEDERGRLALRGAEQLGLTTRFIHPTSQAPTGWVTVRLDDSGQPDYVIQRPAAYDFPKLFPEDEEAIRHRQPSWVYFGTLEQLSPQVRELTRRLRSLCPAARGFYDVNLRKNSYQLPLVRELMAESSVVKLNESEVETLLREFGEPPAGLEAFCRTYQKRFGWEAVLVTRGAQGSSLLWGGEYCESPGYPIRIRDTVGAGDAAAAAFLHGLQAGWTAARIADFANRLGAFVAGQDGAVPEWTPAQLDTMNRLI